LLGTHSFRRYLSVEYKKGDVRTFEVVFRPLWDWAMDLIQDERLRPHFVWDAQRLYKYNGAVFERFYHEPWTADRFWNIQVRIFVKWDVVNCNLL
jgi:hypothetical protein